MVKRLPNWLKIGVHSRFGPNFTVEFEAFSEKKFGLAYVQREDIFLREAASSQILEGSDREKIIDLPGGQINDPASGKYFFSSSPPSNSLVSFLDP